MRTSARQMPDGFRLAVSLALLAACSNHAEDAGPPLQGEGDAGGHAGAAAMSGAAAAAGAPAGAPGVTAGAAGGSAGGAGGAGDVGGASGRGGAPGPAGAAGRAGAGDAGRPSGGSGNAGGADAAGAAVCARWNADRAELGEGTWSGDVATCDPGDISADGRDNALKVVNLYRFLAGLPEVTTSDDRNQKAQACALLMTANGALSHDPPMDWTCWSQDAYDGAHSSNISSGPGVSSVDLYMIDPGNEDTLGHRRWILSNSLGPIGLGSTGPRGSSCLENLDGTGKAGKAWQAWPPPGAFPVQAVKVGRTQGSLDATGWSIQSDSIGLDGASVRITSGGADRPVTVTKLPGGYGSSYAIGIVPNGWQTTAGETYSVSVTGLSAPIDYDVTIVDCSH